MIGIELKPCPFCGGDADISHDHTVEENHAYGCRKCDIWFDTFNSSDAIAAWNSRVTDPDLTAALAQSRAETQAALAVLEREKADHREAVSRLGGKIRAANAERDEILAAIQTDTSKLAQIMEAAKVLLSVNITPEVENAMADAVAGTDDGLWIDADRGACVSSAALENAWKAALALITAQEGK